MLIFVGCSFLSIAHYCRLLICVGCSCQFGSNHYKWTWVALLFELLMSFWDKSVQTKVGCSCQFGSNHYKLIWVVLLFELLMSFWVLSIQTKLGCSLVLVAHVHLGQTITNGHGLLFCLSCSCHFGIKQFKQKSVAL